MPDPRTDELGPAPAGTASIVIPAHNEGQIIDRLLRQLLSAAAPGEFEIIVVCNGCTDNTADIARAHGDAVTVLEIAQPSKREALVAGDAIARRLPRIYVDADVELATQDIRALLAALDEPGILAAAPRRELYTVGSSLLVRGYYAAWQELPQVRDGLFGRGVIALSAEGHARVRLLPPVMSDDLAMSEAFTSAERRIVDQARVVVRQPKTLSDLMRRRIRVNTGNAQLDQLSGRSADARPASATWPPCFDDVRPCCPASSSFSA
jgi:glycosyltransferase involved in cell wall biosynthesis